MISLDHPVAQPQRRDAGLIPETKTLQVPLRILKRGGRKKLQLPEDAVHPLRTGSTLVKAPARTFRSKRMLEIVGFATIAALAEPEGIAPSYIACALRFTLIAPDIVKGGRGYSEQRLRWIA